MIPASAITAWGVTAPWPTRAQVEQDLILSRLIVEIANHHYLGQELIFRGGTCLHKVQLADARRYSEDLDYVRSTAGGIGPLTSALIELGIHLGFETRTRIGQHPKVYLTGKSADGDRLRIKIEINTHERSPAQPIIAIPYAVRSPWFTAEAQVRTFAPAELMATKIRALYQRRKGRDLFDLWLALTEMKITPTDLISALGPYRPIGLTTRTATDNLLLKIRNDLLPLVTRWPDGYDVDSAAHLLISEVYVHL